MAESSAGSAFDCLICSESFEVNGGLVDHLCEHLSYRKYRCGSCEKTFISERKQKKHCEKKSHFRIYQPSINLYNELLLEQFQKELAFLRGGGDMDQLIAVKQNSFLKLQNIRRDHPSHGRTEVPVLSTSTNSAKEKRVMSSTPQDANEVANKKTATSRTIQSARAIVNTESIASPPSGFTNNTKGANLTTPSLKSRGTTSDAQLQPITLGSSDSEFDDEDAIRIIPRREDMLYCTVDTSDEENTTGGSSSKRNASFESRKLAVVRCASDSDNDGNVRSFGSTTERVRKDATEGDPPKTRTREKSMYGEGEEFSMVTLSGSKTSSLSWMFKPFANVTCQICRNDGPSDYVSRRQHVSSFHLDLENNDLTLKRYWHSLEAQMQKAYPGMTYSDLHCQYPGCPEKQYYSQHLRRAHVRADHSPYDMRCVFDECSFLSTNAPEMELHLKNKHEKPNGSKSLSPLLADAFVRERLSKNHQLAVIMEFCFPGAIPLHLTSQSDLNEVLGEARFLMDLDLLEASLSTIVCGTLQRKDCNDEEVSSRDSESSTRKRARTTSCCSTNSGFGTTTEIAVDPTISSLNWVLFFQSCKVKCQFCNHEGSGDYVYRKYHVASKHMNQSKMRDTDYYSVLQRKMLEAYPGMTFSDMQCQYPGCGRMYTRENSRSAHVWNDHTLKDMRCIFRGCTFLSSCLPEMEEHLQVTHNQRNGSKSLGNLAVVAFVSMRRRKIRQVAAMVECCFPCPVPLHASRTALKQLMIEALGSNALQDDESAMVIPSTPNSNKPVQGLKRRRARPDESNDQFIVVETAQGVVTNNDVDGNVLKANGTAAKVSQIDLIIREEERRMWKRDRRTIFFDGIQNDCSLKSISRVIPDFETFHQSSKFDYGSLSFKTRTLMLKSFRKLMEVGDPKFGKPSYRQKKTERTGSEDIDRRALFVEGIPRAVNCTEIATAFPGVRAKVRICVPKYELKHHLRPNNALVWFKTEADAKKAFDGGGKLKIGGQRVVVFYARNDEACAKNGS